MGPFRKILSSTVNICAYEFRVYSFLYVIKYIIVNDYFCHLCGVILTLKNNGCDIHITQNIQDLSDNTQQNNLYSREESAISFTDDTHCDYSISDHTSDTENLNDTHRNFMPKYPTIHSQRKHAYRDTFGNAHIQYHDFDYYSKNYKTHTGIYMTQ